MLKYFISILLLGFCLHAAAQDADESDEQRNAIIDSAHQVRLGFDVGKLLFNQLQNGKQKKTGYEIEFDYYHRKDMFFVLEGGWGNGSLNYSDLSYKSSNIFFRGGINKSLLPRLRQNDWDMAFIGLRYGVGFIDRSAADYSITDSTWGVVSGTFPATNLTAHWIELTGGVRVEIIKQVFLGWSVRGKFLLNGKKFTELPPYYIAGYGRGEKNSIFDFNIYLGYALRWDKKAKHIKQ
ncbi:MAG: hypothetical protein KDC07_07575 [Chitinophagaceae bacterium]|nr:hypothetical protein [Chitinophagaceae bacterium]MCB9045846.1 hypothetical protein [Chitinophagales bacterium]